MNLDELGFVVIGRNEGQRLVDCLNSLAPYAGKVVYVDSGSTDSSVPVAQRAGARIVQLDSNRPFTAARARNEGFAALVAAMPQIRFVQFIDGDCELVSSWPGHALAFLSTRSDVAVACGRRRERDPGRSIYNRLCDIEWDTPVGETTACGGDSLVRVDAFREVAGFRPDLIAGEEPEFCARLREKGWKIWRLDADMTRHDAAMTRFAQWWRRAVRGGYAQAACARLHLSSKEMARDKRAVASAIFWAGLLPAVIVFGSIFFHAGFLALVLAYPVQAGRIALRKDPRNPVSWSYAILVMIAKFAELKGAMMYVWSLLRGQPGPPIEYKRAA